MQPGDVIYWHDFQLQKDGEVKNKYFSISENHQSQKRQFW